MNNTLQGVKRFLLQYRILELTATAYLCYELHNLILWMTSVPYKDLTEWQLAPVTATLPALITGLFATIKLAIQRRKEGEEE